MARGPGRLGRGALVLERPDLATQAFVKKVDDCADAGRLAHAFVSQQPENTAVVIAGRNASDQIRIGVGDHTGKNRDPKAQPKKVEIKTGISDGLNVEVLSGLKKGDKVVERPPKEIS